MKKIFTALILAFVICACTVDKDRTNPYDPDYDGPTGTIFGRAVIEGGSAFTFTGPTGSQVQVNHSGITVQILELGWHIAYTDAFGNYQLGDIPEGTWTLLFSLPGYKTQVVANVTVSASSVVRIGTVSMAEIVTGNLLFNSSNTATGFFDIVEIDDDGSDRFQFSFQEAEMESGDQLGNSRWVALALWYIFGSYTIGYRSVDTDGDTIDDFFREHSPKGVYILDLATGFFNVLVLDRDVLMTGFQEGSIEQVTWGPLRPTAAARSLVITGGSAADKLGMTGLSASETPNKGLYFTFRDSLNNDSFIGHLGVYVSPDPNVPPRLSGVVTSSKPGPYNLADLDTLDIEVDGGVWGGTITFFAGTFAAMGFDITNLSAGELAYYINYASDLFLYGLAAHDDGSGRLVIKATPFVEMVTGTTPDPPGLHYEEENPVMFDNGVTQRLFFSRTAEDLVSGAVTNFIQNRDPIDDVAPYSLVWMNWTRVQNLDYEEMDVDNDLSDGIPDAFKMIALRAYFINNCGDDIKNFAAVDFSEIKLAPDNDYTVCLGFFTVPAGTPLENNPILGECIPDCAIPNPGSVLYGTTPDAVTLDFDAFNEELARMEKVYSMSVLPYTWIEDEGTMWEREVTAMIHSDRRLGIPQLRYVHYEVINDGSDNYCNDLDFDGACTSPEDEPFGDTQMANINSIKGLPELILRQEFSTIWYTVLDISGVTAFAWESDLFLNGVVAVDFSPWELISSDENKFINDLGFSPMGDRIVYTNGVRSESSGDVYDSDIFTYDPDNGVAKEVTKDRANNRKPIWISY